MIASSSGEKSQFFFFFLKTAGAAAVSLRLCGWSLLDVDPFFQAKTSEELEGDIFLLLCQSILMIAPRYRSQRGCNRHQHCSRVGGRGETKKRLQPFFFHAFSLTDEKKVCWWKRSWSRLTNSAR